MACLSNIRNQKYSPATTAALTVSHSGYRPPPWILKGGGLKSSDQILISLNGKTKRGFLVFVFLKQNIKI